ncbi:asparagine synthase (glutamine-hydrolyzing) [Helicobacter sp. MIT 11-5569]|uniref:asparagine synthase (glutamine-hydrolyzing) n=1 Tax=Helicobacter sp. MIT 11-5569 TaxID=1548151 RepID=UPI00051FBA3F|nr:asparagine synthase (glutamine-hydrolyzing) [Helicobacter sp. MIT 11-5569]TLD82884.1 asparagine synthase (glutamine-hydrolyzing) [Helicobacter sp. MIT 11-5569]
MCGIAGSLNTTRLPIEQIYPLMQHRGPDAKGAFYDSTQWGLLQFFHARLSIQDLSPLAHQPMQYENLCLVFNGEIYNHLDFRKNLDFPFKTHSDTETILALFAHYGEQFLEQLNAFDGMFAFALYDKAAQKVYFARDRMGKKPIFLYQDSTKFAFASELNTLHALLDNALEIDKNALNFYLQSGFFHHDGTPYENIFALPNASYGILDLKTHSLEIQPYFSLESCYKAPKITDENEALQTCEALLKQSIQNRIDSSDLEVGAFLSGGIDSSLIVALSAQITPKLRTFTVSFENSSFDETHLAQITAKRYDTLHTTLKISTNLKDDVPKILQNYGRPFFDSSAIPSFYVAKAAKEHLSVILNGDGADELFGGYRRYVGHLLLNKILPFSFFANLLPNPNTKQSLYNYFYRLLQMANAYKKDLSEYYLRATTDIFTGVYNFPQNPNFKQEVESVFHSNLSPLSKMLLLDAKHLLLCDLLPKMDIATMAHSLEGRSPFLSKTLVEFAPRLDDNLKVRKNVTKYLLRKLAEKYLDKAVCNAPKRGFEVPLAAWVDGELKSLILETLQTPKITQEFLEKNTLESLCFKPHLFSKEKRAKMLWSLFALEMWYQNQHKKL